MAKIITFHGADHRCGCSMLAQCAAEKIAKSLPGCNILLVHAEQSAGPVYAPGAGESMERLRPYLSEKLINVKEIIQRSFYKDDLYVIAGTNVPGSSESFHPDLSEWFMKSIAQSFDLVICDSGANIEHGLSLGALFASDSIYIVLDQSENTFRRYEWLSTLYDRLALNIRGFVLNRCTKGSPFSKAYAAKRLGAERSSVFTVSESAYGSLAEIDERSLLAYRDDRFSEDVGTLAAAVLRDAGLDRETYG
ncbi:MAG: hypothetical protein IKX89_05075 [Firmicutes bacterium]|nr:hypothetical protein [Bacillota bacterium]